jgi:quercetin dioxygenase-like cupin family protein
MNPEGRTMRVVILTAMLVAVVACLVGCSAEEQEVDWASRQITVKEIAAQTPQHAKLLFENDYVMVAEFTIEPGDSIPSHYGRNRAVYALDDYKMKFTYGDNQIIEEPKKDTIHWHQEGIHAAENMGEVVARFIVVFRKLSRLFDYSVIGTAKDFTCVAAEHSEVLLENPYMRVARFTLLPGETLPLHRGLNRVTYSLTAYDLKYISDTVGTLEQSCDAGSVHYYEADSHAIENSGETAARYLMFEMKE